MIFWIRASWCWLVALCMARTFGITPEGVAELRRNLADARSGLATWRNYANHYAAERDAYETLANKIAGSNAPTLPSMRAAEKVDDASA